MHEAGEMAVVTGAEGSGALTHSLLVRVLGSSADAVSEAIRRYTDHQLRNVRRIVECANAKSTALDETGMVNLRVAQVILADGSHCDDALTANYLGGLLAASRTPQGRDDRAVSWSGLVTSLSVLQLRAHYLSYREWAARLRIVGIYELGLEAVQAQATMEISSPEFVRLLIGDSGADENDVMGHAIGGLIEGGLLADNLRSNGSLARVTPSITGLELYGWAQGLPGLSPRSFAAKARIFELTEDIPRPRSVSFPGLPLYAEPTGRPSRSQVQVQVQRQVRRAKGRR